MFDLFIQDVYICGFALKEFHLKIQANTPAERTLKEEFAKNGMEFFFLSERFRVNLHQ